MPMICDDPRMAAYFLDSEGKSFARHEHELYMPLLLKDLPEDIGPLIYVGSAGNTGLPSYLNRWRVKVLDIDPGYKSDIVADIRSTGLPPESMGGVLLISVLEHIFETQQVIDECWRIIEPGGYLIIDVPWVYPYHAQDDFKDYWRISKDGLQQLTKQFSESYFTQGKWSTYGWAKK